MKQEFYCGCCGRQIGERELWCRDCTAHVKHTSEPIWERTYFAQYGKDCPFTEPFNVVVHAKKGGE